MRRIAITDIHGCLDSFKALLDKIAYTSEDELYLLGDYIDRGPDSKGVIDLILKLREQGHEILCLTGNHEAMFLEIAGESEGTPLDLYPGLPDTLLSYGCHHPRDIPMGHLDFMSTLPYYHEVDGFLLVHAGLNFRIANPLDDLSSMIWERYWYTRINKDWLQDRIILHGHTPTYVDDILRMYAGLDILQFMVLDSGCVYDRRGLHQLTAFDMTNRKLYFQENVEG
ncbi:MAG: metallophosphoesterase family protein [Saprospiraceae bacterium]|nr:serine/threonine protein phosphatase [Lewinella sp.]